MKIFPQEKTKPKGLTWKEQWVFNIRMAFAASLGRFTSLFFRISKSGVILYHSYLKP